MILISSLVLVLKATNVTPMLTSSTLLLIAVVAITIAAATNFIAIIRGATEVEIVIIVVKAMKARVNGNLKATFRKVIRTIVTITRGVATAALAFAFNL